MDTQSTRLISCLISLAILSPLITGCSSSGTGTGSGSGSGVQFDSGSLGQNETFSFTFNEEGTVDYYCEFHSPDMQGEVIVSSSASTSGQDTVEMINLQFQPGQLTVPPNTEVVWINRDSDAHTVSSGNPQTNGGGGY